MIMKEIVSFAFYTILWFLICTIIEKLLKGSSKNDHDIKNRIVSMIHGLTTFFLATEYILRSSDNFCSKSTIEEKLIIKLSVSYFIYDFAACLYFQLYDLNLIIHHTSSILGFLVSYYVPFGAKISIFGLMIAESSNFPMHMRVILRLKGLRHTKLFNLFEISYLVLYVLFRGSLCPPLMIAAFKCTQTNIAVIIMCSILSIQSFYFIAQIIPIFKSKMIELKEIKKAGIQSFWLSQNKQLEELDYFKKSKSQNIF